MKDKFIKTLIIASVICALYIVLKVTLSPAQPIVANIETNNNSLASSEIYNQLKDTAWVYQAIINKESIPIPTSMKNAINPKVDSVYSPSVIKQDSNLYLLFGVSLSCKAGGTTKISRDSIALAKSVDGNTWQFLKYLIEPNTTTCFADLNTWYSGAIFQINDPYAFIDNGIIRVLYTSTEWQPSKNSYGCGNLGIAAYTKNFEQLYRNDRFLSGISECSANTTGFSRPSLRKTVSGSNEIWMDTNYKVKTIPLTAIDRIVDTKNVRVQSIVGGDVDTPNFNSSTPLVLYNGGLHGFQGIIAQININNSWTQPWELTKLSGNTWDSWYHSSPFMYLDSSCNPTLYFSGMRAEQDIYGNKIPVGTIAKASLPSNKKVKFDKCYLYK